MSAANLSKYFRKSPHLFDTFQHYDCNDAVINLFFIEPVEYIPVLDGVVGFKLHRFPQYVFNVYIFRACSS